MILLIAVVLGFVATLVRAKLKRRSLKPLQLRIGWLVFAAVIPQLLSFQIPATGKLIPEVILPVILIATQALLVIFAIANLREPGFWALGTGLLANFLVIVLNGGWMPISPDTLRRMLPALPAETVITSERLLLTKDWIMLEEQTRLAWLSDRLTLPGVTTAFSIGDVFISIGAFLLIWSLSSQASDKKEEE